VTGEATLLDEAGAGGAELLDDAPYPGAIGAELVPTGDTFELELELGAGTGAGAE
jgi:hypothetical protein